MPFEFDPNEFNECERYELRAAPRYRFDTNRREFMHVMGTGIAIVATTKLATAQRPQGRGRSSPRATESLAQRFHISPDGVVTVFSSKVEVGQGARTQIAQAAAEELRLPLDRIQVHLADSELCPDDGGTAGSRTTPATVPRVRQAAAAARELLLAHVAKKFDVPAAKVQFDAGIFRVNGSRNYTLAEFIADEPWQAVSQITPPETAALSGPEHWQVLGQSIPKPTGRDIVTGAAQYPSDIRRPGMYYGAVLRPATLTATLKHIDLAPAQALSDVVAVRDGEFVGCAAPTSWQARKGVEALAATAEWKTTPHPSSEELYDHLKQTASRPREQRWGNGAAALARADKRLDASYTVAYIQHAPMEPRAAVAEWEGEKLTVWIGTQQPARVQSELSRAFRIAAPQIRVIVPDTGGGFGGKHSGEVAIEAARLAKAANRPVSLCWTREEEFTWAYFRPAGLIEIQAGLDAAGNLIAWDFANYNSGASAIATPYDIPHGQTQFFTTDAPLRQGSYRALASTANTFARECAMDELADMSGADPLDFRLRHLSDGRLKDVLLTAAQQFGWRNRSTNRGRGIGLACGTEKGSFVAACAEVEIVDGKIRVVSVCQAYECGAIQNPDNLRAQVEGSIIMGLGGALSEEICFRDGIITNASFAEYQVPRMVDVPELDIVLLNRTDLPSVGGGETPIIAVAPAIANAVYRSVGVRSRSMPLTL